MRRSRRAICIFITLVFATFAAPARATAASLFFSHNSTAEHRIGELPLTGEPVVTVYGGLTDPFGVAVDVQNGKMYWTDAGTDSVHRASIDGSGPIEDLITNGLFDPHDITLDPSGGKLYFADRRNSMIKSADLDGSNVEALLSVTLPTYLEVDPASQKIYFVFGASGPPLIGRANLDGSNLETIVSSSSALHGLALDHVDRKIYFSVRNGAEIHRIDFDGTNEEIFLANLDAVPLDLAIDGLDRKLYWSFFSGIQSIPLDGQGGPNTLLAGLPGLSGLNGINGIALDSLPVPEPSTAFLLASGFLGLAMWRRRVTRGA